MRVTTDHEGVRPKLSGFLSDHESPEKVVSITVESDVIYIEEARDSNNLNFDFIVEGLTEKKLVIKFIKVAVYDEDGNLIKYRHLNHNGVGTPGIHTIGKYEIEGREVLDIYNPFHYFSKTMPLSKLRYMFTFMEPETKEEFYYGNIIVKPSCYRQKVKLNIPLKGMMTILDGHDYYSHHRRFSMTLVRTFTNNAFQSNFSRFAVDFTILGEDGNTRKMNPGEYPLNYDFHFTDVTKFYTHGAVVFAPAEGEIVDVEDNLDDLFGSPFDMDEAIRKDRVADIAGNYVIIKHNKGEFSHLFHLQRGSVQVAIGDMVSRGQPIAKIGFSGAATTYSHLHYQLLDGADFLKDNPLPCQFSDVFLLRGKEKNRFDRISVDTGDIISQE